MKNVETKAWKRTLPTEPVRYYGAFKWGGYWHTIRRNMSISGSPVRLFRSPEAAKAAAAKAAPSAPTEIVEAVVVSPKGRKPAGVKAIVDAQRRVDRAHDHLIGLDAADPRLDPSLAEYEGALAARQAAEQGSLDAKASRKPVEPRPAPAAIIPAACPTGRTYSGLTHAYGFFNRELFGGELPSCLVTLQRKAKTFGYFAAERFGTRDKSETTDEIALNPSHFASRSTREVLSTLVHEMAHLKRQRTGKAPRGGYHDKGWAEIMREVGLIPSNTGQPGGKETGQKVSHYIEQGGRFDLACARLEAEGFDLAYVDLWDEAKAERAKKAKASKTKYTCPSCDANAWAKPEAKLVCGECDERMEEA